VHGKSVKTSLKIPPLWVMDFDGTLKPLDKPVAGEDLLALKALGASGCVRAIATGRSIRTFERDWDPSIEIDYLISSSGLALSSFGPDGHRSILKNHAFSPEDAKKAIDAAEELGLGFFLSFPPPLAHDFYYRLPPKNPPSSFMARLGQYHRNARPFEGERGFPMAQVLLMGEPEVMKMAKKRFQEMAPGLSYVSCSSPYGDGSRWLEIYPEGVSKAHAAQALASLLGLSRNDAVALGNDYNDEDLLAWAGLSFVSEESPFELKKLYRNMPPAGKGPLDYALKAVQEERLSSRKS
jgi:hydroxymethylpyrimidine pyrophosphatase-like HAD family hydrolase